MEAGITKVITATYPVMKITQWKRAYYMVIIFTTKYLPVITLVISASIAVKPAALSSLGTHQWSPVIPASIAMKLA